MRSPFLGLKILSLIPKRVQAVVSAAQGYNSGTHPSYFQVVSDPKAALTIGPKRDDFLGHRVLPKLN